MSNLKELSLRIKSIKSIQKTTKVMQVISAAKLHKSQHRLHNIREYIFKLHDIIINSRNESPLNDNVERQLTSNSHLIIIISSDRGLCGSFSYSIVKKVKSYIDNLITQNKNVSLLFWGKKAYELMKKQYQHLTLKVFHHEKNISGFSSFRHFIYKTSIDAEQFVSVEVCYNQFHNIMLQKPVIKTILPIVNTIKNNDIATKQNNKKILYEYEPDRKKNIDILKKQYFFGLLYNALLESITSEHCARMIAMESANRNTKDMINKLTLNYNRSRQSAITTDLIEIIGGAEALAN